MPTIEFLGSDNVAYEITGSVKAINELAAILRKAGITFYIKDPA